MLDLLHRQFAGKRHAPRTQLGGRADARFVMRVHLRRDMKTDPGKRARQLGGDADILHDEGVGAGAVGLPRGLEGAIDLRGKHGGVERHVHAHAAQMGVVAGCGKRLDRKVLRAAAGVERVEAEVDRVGPSADGGMERRGASGGGEQFDIVQHGAPSSLSGRAGGAGASGRLRGATSANGALAREKRFGYNAMVV